MQKLIVLALIVFAGLTCAIFAEGVNGYDADLENGGEYAEPQDYMESNAIGNADKRSSQIYVYRRGCIRRGGNCDHRPNECCFSSSCRCNLWGSNCRCQRMGLFQKWG